MTYVGIDVAKLNHCASFVDSDGVILVEPFEFQNNHEGFQKLLKHLTSFPNDDLLIGMESTAHYAENLTCFLYTRGFNVCIINLYVLRLSERATSEKQKRIPKILI